MLESRFLVIEKKQGGGMNSTVGYQGTRNLGSFKVQG